MKRILLITFILSAIAYGIWFVANSEIPTEYNATVESITETKTEKDKKIDQIMKRQDFKQQAEHEAEKWYYRELIEHYNEERTKAIDSLESLDSEGFAPDAEKTAALQSFLINNNAHPDLIASASQIVKMDRWMEIVAIIGKETSYCTAGVGKSRNNCGAIRKDSKSFREYSTKVASLSDMERLLQKPLYKDKTIAQMNGTYCVNEVAGSGPCPGWTEHIEIAVEEIKLLAYAGI